MPRRLLLFVPLFVTVLSASQTPAGGDTRVVIQSDGWQLAGNLRRPEPDVARPAAVLLLHGAARDRRAYLPLAAELAARGIASLRLDLRGEGESTNLGRFEPGTTNALLDGTERDVAAALGWLRRQPGLEGARLGVLGASYSGEAMAVAARTGAAADAYVALSPGSFSDESAGAIDPSGRPWWFLASADERFAIHVVRRLPELSRTARVTIVDGTSHASDILSPHFLLNAEIADWFAATLGRHATPALWGDLTPGGWPVGYTRIAAGPTVMDLWYPAAASSCASPMTFGEYLRRSGDLRGAVEGFPRAPGSVERTLAAAMTGREDGLLPDMASRLVASPMAACLDAAAAPGPAPLVLWTPRYATTVAQAVLSEYLASRGFAVAFARPAAPAPMPFEIADAPAKRAERDARVADMQRALDRLAARPGVDASRTAVLAWSYTGEMAVAIDRADPRVRVVAGLSTNLFDGWVYDAAALPALDPAALDATYAVFHQSAAAPASRPAALDRLRRPAYFVDLPGMTHGAFSALEGYVPALEGVTAVQRWSSADEAARRGYAAVAVMLARLMRHHLPADPPRPLTRLQLTTGLADGVVRR